MKFYYIFNKTFKFLFATAVIYKIVVRYNHEISLTKYAKPNQEFKVVRYNREIVITVIVITEFGCSLN